MRVGEARLGLVTDLESKSDIDIDIDIGSIVRGAGSVEHRPRLLASRALRLPKSCFPRIW